MLYEVITKTGVVQAVFYQAGELTVSEDLKISSDSQGAVILKCPDGVLKEITAADPSRMLGSLHLNISGIGDLSFRLPEGDYAGQSVSVAL